MNEEPPGRAMSTPPPQPIPIKVYLTRQKGSGDSSGSGGNGAAPQIHRFRGAYSWDEMYAHVVKLWGNPNHLVLEYCDDEGDRVRVANATEWEECQLIYRQRNQTEPLRLFVCKNKKLASHPQPEALPVTESPTEAVQRDVAQACETVEAVGSDQVVDNVTEVRVECESETATQQLPTEQVGPAHDDNAGAVSLLQRVFDCPTCSDAAFLVPGNTGEAAVPPAARDAYDLVKRSDKPPLLLLNTDKVGAEAIRRGQGMVQDGHHALADTMLRDVIALVSGRRGGKSAAGSGEDEAQRTQTLARCHRLRAAALAHLGRLDDAMGQLDAAHSLGTAKDTILEDPLLRPLSEYIPFWQKFTERAPEEYRPGPTSSADQLVCMFPGMAKQQAEYLLELAKGVFANAVTLALQSPRPAPPPPAPPQPKDPKAEQLMTIFPFLSKAEADAALWKAKGVVPTAINAILQRQRP